ncbi:endomucin [Castor canadensis]|uniref:Endomucin n=1 Tax=Castor canadensis TaxID=51338 RepID=A0A250XX97_CASCN|nr:endomucin [Castor canadensis]XP_020042003.1 endomucin [Castor canadensis]
MQLLQVTILCLLLSSLCSSDDGADVPSPVNSTTKAKASVTPDTKAAPTPTINATLGTTPKGTTNNELSKTPVTPTPTSLTTGKSEENTTHDVTTNELITTKATVTTLSCSDAVTTLQRSQNKTENQSLIQTTAMSVHTQQPDASPPKTTKLLSTAETTPDILQFQGTKDGKNATSSSNIPSSSSVILPVVIALIVITLSVFVLVGLYRMCRKKDPGTPENGHDQPQSDKESVKLLTVKTISHDSGEHSAQGKTKN